MDLLNKLGPFFFFRGFFILLVVLSCKIVEYLRVIDTASESYFGLFNQKSLLG